TGYARRNQKASAPTRTLTHTTAATELYGRQGSSQPPRRASATTATPTPSSQWPVRRMGNKAAKRPARRSPEAGPASPVARSEWETEPAAANANPSKTHEAVRAWKDRKSPVSHGLAKHAARTPTDRPVSPRT